MAQKIILGLIGEMAAGKTTATNYLKQKHGAVTFRFSDILRDVLTRLHIEHTRAHLQTVSLALRKNLGEDVLAKVLAEDVALSTHPLIIAEGVRRPSDIVYLKKLPNFFLINLTADERIRYERLVARRENPDDAKKTWEQFQSDGKQEAELEIQNIAREAKYSVDNNGTMESFEKQLDDVIKKI